MMIEGNHFEVYLKHKKLKNFEYFETFSSIDPRTIVNVSVLFLTIESGRCFIYLPEKSYSEKFIGCYSYSLFLILISFTSFNCSLLEIIWSEKTAMSQSLFHCHSNNIFRRLSFSSLIFDWIKSHIHFILCIDYKVIFKIDRQVFKVLFSISVATRGNT